MAGSGRLSDILQPAINVDIPEQKKSQYFQRFCGPSPQLWRGLFGADDLDRSPLAFGAFDH
jgi:hypothetical protein